VIRPTGLLDPEIELRAATNQVDDCLDEIRKETNKEGRILVTTLTKRLAEDLSKYLEELGIKAKYLHSDIDTIERVQIIKELRTGVFDVLVGINLLREGLDIPEVTLVAILDADKEGFLRSETSLIQTCGRAARNAEGRVVMYADKMTKSIQKTIDITETRRELQKAYNEKHGITPKTTKRDIVEDLSETFFGATDEERLKTLGDKPVPVVMPEDVRKMITEYEAEMKKAAKEHRFEEAARYRDLLKHYRDLEVLEDYPV